MTLTMLDCECGGPTLPGCFSTVIERGAARSREIKLGAFGPMMLAEARKALGRMNLDRERGIDPQLEKQHARTEARRQRDAEKLARYTVENLVEHYTHRGAQINVGRTTSSSSSRRVSEAAG